MRSAQKGRCCEWQHGCCTSRSPGQHRALPCRSACSSGQAQITTVQPASSRAPSQSALCFAVCTMQSHTPHQHLDNRSNMVDTCLSHCSASHSCLKHFTVKTQQPWLTAVLPNLPPMLQADQDSPPHYHTELPGRPKLP